MKPDRNRRLLLLGVSGLLLGGAARAGGLLATPRQPAGPFYPDELPLDHDNDLTRVAGRGGRAQGRITDLTGRVLDTAGRPVPGARIEIWQCDAQGRYRHPLDPGDAPIDPDFQGFGRTQTAADGRYRFRTIRPVAYPGRTPHIHLAVHLDWEPPFVTQLYVAGEPLNDGDFLYRRIPAERRGLVTTEFRPAGGEAELAASFDVVLGRDGTPAV
jgi:protocatechuate 3,4-dioxygenase beta subunit